MRSGFWQNHGYWVKTFKYFQYNFLAQILNFKIASSNFFLSNSSLKVRWKKIPSCNIEQIWLEKVPFSKKERNKRRRKLEKAVSESKLNLYQFIVLEKRKFYVVSLADVLLNFLSSSATWNDGLIETSLAIPFFAIPFLDRFETTERIS